MIVLSVVWSILSQIIEKKKAAAKKNASLDSSSLPTVQTEWNADPIQIKIFLMLDHGVTFDQLGCHQV